MEPLRVTAHTPAGFCAADPWSPSLDAILAYWALRARLGEEAFALNLVAGEMAELAPDDLPLGVERWRDLWWWQVSSPQYAPLARETVWQHRRLNALEAERYTTAKRIEGKAGPYKNYRLMRTVQVADRVVWHAIGDGATVLRLLRRCTAIGAGRGSGRGEVVRWEVQPGGDAEAARFGRPLPLDFAQEHGIMGAEMRWGIRPPGWHPAHQHLCVMPEGG